MPFSHIKITALTKQIRNSLFHLFKQNVLTSVWKNTDLFKGQDMIGWLFPVKEKERQIDRALEKSPINPISSHPLHIKHHISQSGSSALVRIKEGIYNMTTFSQRLSRVYIWKINPLMSQPPKINCLHQMNVGCGFYMYFIITNFSNIKINLRLKIKEETV